METYNHKEQLTIHQRYIKADLNTIVKDFISSIKQELKDARKCVRTKEFSNLNDLGLEILNHDSKNLNSVSFYAYFDDKMKCTNQMMSISEIEKGIKEGKKLTFLRISYIINKSI